MKRRVCSVLVCCLFSLTICTAPAAGAAQQNGTQPGGEEAFRPAAGSESQYQNYLTANANVKAASGSLTLKAEEAVLSDGAVLDGDAAEFPESSVGEWTIVSPEDALYNLRIDYYPLTGRLTDIELALEIDGESPFDEAEKLNVSRAWKLDGDIERDNNDNDIRPGQVEAPEWMSEYAADKNGYVTRVFAFRLTEGTHTVRIRLTRDTFALRSLTFETKPTLPSYEESLAEHPDATVIGEYKFKQQAEDMYRTSHSMIYANDDRGNPAVEPSDPSKIRLNSIGAVNWDKGGQWVAWQVEVEEPGFYQLHIKYRQNAVRGFSTSRRLLINGRVPFEEMDRIDFPYTSGQNWTNMTLANEEGEPYLFYLEKGMTIALEVVSSETGELLREVNDVIYRLNDLYRQIIMITGTTPDSLRDYYLDKEIPQLIPTLQEQSDRIQALMADFGRASTDAGGSQVSFMKEVVAQLNSFIKKPETIQTRLQQFQSNISSLADLNLSLKNQPLQLDYLTITGSVYEKDRENAGFFETLSYRFMAFISSFFEDYNAVGNTYQASEDQKPIDVWVSANDLATSGYASGRDQMSVIKRLIDDQFVPQTGLLVNLRLVDSSSTLTQAILAKQGPDCALIVPSQTPINLAMRDALVELSSLEGFQETRGWFYDSAFIPYIFQDGVYAMPETQVFWMIFYRKDILAGMGLEPPDTWEDFYKAVSVIMKNNMQIGVPENQQIFETLLMQNGAQMYNADFTATALDSQNAINAFTEWTSLYTNYSFPMEFDAFSRFRTGEMPMMLMPYSFYNQLTVGAPEIANMWGMLPMPAREVDGEMSRISSSAGTGSIILRDAENVEDCFRFVKWWTGPEVQAAFGTEIEAVLGPAARYNAANVEAFRRLPWSASEQAVILEQWEDVSAVHNVPGNYYVSRCLTNAFRRAAMYYDSPRETLLKYNRQINGEITRKREELGLS